MASRPECPALSRSPAISVRRGSGEALATVADISHPGLSVWPPRLRLHEDGYSRGKDQGPEGATGRDRPPRRRDVRL